MARFYGGAAPIHCQLKGLHVATRSVRSGLRGGAGDQFQVLGSIRRIDSFYLLPSRLDALLKLPDSGNEGVAFSEAVDRATILSAPGVSQTRPASSSKQSGDHGA
jgi:hypothetical protein